MGKGSIIAGTCGTARPPRETPLAQTDACTRQNVQTPFPTCISAAIGRGRPRKGGRVVDCSGLENRRCASIRGFESHPFRQYRRSILKLTDYLAVYGAALSTLVFVWNARRASPQVRVRVVYTHGMVVDGELKNGVGIFIQNPSASTAHVTAVSFVYPLMNASLFQRIGHLVKYRRSPRRMGWCHSSLQNFGLNVGLPTSIEPAKSHLIFVPGEVIEKLLLNSERRRFIIQVQDALWRNKYSKPFHYM